MSRRAFEFPSLRDYITPPQYARSRGVHVRKVLGWIARGELQAINLADRLGERPRWRIPPEAIEEFERRRSVQPETRTPRPRKTQRKYYT